MNQSELIDQTCKWGIDTIVSVLKWHRNTSPPKAP